MNGFFNKKGPIKHMVKLNINSKIDWRTEKVKMTRCPKECRKQWRPKQGKLGWQKQKEE